MKRLFLACLLLTKFLLVVAQDQPHNSTDLQQITDEILGAQDDDQNYQEHLENISLLLSNPLDLNKVAPEELRFLNILSEQQVNHFFQYRQNYGHLLSVYELQAIPGFTLPVINKLLPFVTVADPSTVINKSLLLRLLHEKNNYLLMRYEQTLEQKQGASEATPPEDRFIGSPENLYLRFRTSRPGDFSLGFTAEKDAGEALSWSPNENQFAFDFTSFHLQLQNKGRLKNMLLGDFQIQAGQGLVAGTNLGWGKGAETITTTRKSNVGILPYTSSIETGYLHGVGATYQVAHDWRVTGFYSRTPNDGSVTMDSSGTLQVSSIQTTGFHRNKKELATRNRVTEKNFGTIINYTYNNLDAGFIFQASSLSQARKQEPSPYNQFSLAENVNQNGSFFFNYSHHNIALFSEVAKNLSGGGAALAGLLGSVSSRLDISLVYRNYARNYYAPHSNAFGESSLTQNERGFYWGLKYQLHKKSYFSGYADFFFFPWLRYRSYAPSSGHELLLRFNYQVTKNSLIILQAKEESKQRNLSDVLSATYRTDIGVKRNYLFHAQVGASKNLRFRMRAQFSTFSFAGKTTYGALLIQDIRWEFRRLSITGRHALFDTEDYDNRLYSYEDDVWLAFSLPAYSGTGIRNYIMIEYKLSNHISLWLRYARVHYINQNTIGSGLDTIEGNKRHDIKFQVMAKF